MFSEASIVLRLLRDCWISVKWHSLCALPNDVQDKMSLGVGDLTRQSIDFLYALCMVLNVSRVFVIIR